MKKTSLFIFIVLIMTCRGYSQHPLVGTWEMISIKGINAENERFAFDTTTVREIKVITPTHYMLIAENVEGDSLVFNRTYAGTIKLDGNRYIETPLLSSLPIFENVKSNFTWKLERDRFIQSGTFTRPDGKTIILEEMLFRRVLSKKSFDNNPALGTWSQVSSSYVNYDGKKEFHNNETTTRFHIVTPTHWMCISHKDEKFEHAMLGTYVINSGKSFLVVEHASFPIDNLGKIETTESIEGDKLYMTGMMAADDGKKFTWNDVFQRVK